MLGLFCEVKKNTHTQINKCTFTDTARFPGGCIKYLRRPQYTIYITIKHDFLLPLDRSLKRPKQLVQV